MPLLQQLHEAGLAALGPGSHAAVAGLQYPSEFAQVALHVLRPPLTEAGRHLLAPPLWSAAGALRHACCARALFSRSGTLSSLIKLAKRNPNRQ